jgi:hypothetical protein
MNMKLAWSKLFHAGFMLVLLFDREEIGYLFLFYFEDGGSRFFRNVGNILPDYTVSHPRRE